ncbi:MAG: hypothetical protein GY789_06155 [Hyphomicrobiales bacterium]|nr:hypothetical protein [Hyphomicrobiales bacterium]
MVTEKQKLGDWGEQYVASWCVCPSCKREKTTRLLPTNFKCSDLICDFCGYLSQVKTARVKDVDRLPKQILGAAWKPQFERMTAGIYFPLYVVLADEKLSRCSAFFLSADLQTPEMFKPRKPLSAHAKRAGWQGFVIDCDMVRDRFIRLK